MPNDIGNISLNKLKLTKIGDSDYRFDVWYKVSDKSKIPFGWHVKQEEIEKCENILFTYDFCKDEVFRKWDMDVIFFMDSREYGCGGHVFHFPKIPFGEDLWGKFVELLQKSADVIKNWGLELNKEKLIESIQKFEDQKKEIDCSISTLKQMLENL